MALWLMAPGWLAVQQQLEHWHNAAASRLQPATPPPCTLPSRLFPTIFPPAIRFARAAAPVGAPGTARA